MILVSIADILLRYLALVQECCHVLRNFRINSNRFLKHYGKLKTVKLCVSIALACSTAQCSCMSLKQIPLFFLKLQPFLIFQHSLAGKLESVPNLKSCTLTFRRIYFRLFIVLTLSAFLSLIYTFCSCRKCWCRYCKHKNNRNDNGYRFFHSVTSFVIFMACSILRLDSFFAALQYVVCHFPPPFPARRIRSRYYCCCSYSELCRRCRIERRRFESD